MNDLIDYKDYVKGDLAFIASAGGHDFHALFRVGLVNFLAVQISKKGVVVMNVPLDLSNTSRPIEERWAKFMTDFNSLLSLIDLDEVEKSEVEVFWEKFQTLFFSVVDEKIIVESSE